MYLCKYCASVSINHAKFTPSNDKTPDLSKQKYIFAASRLVLSYGYSVCHTVQDSVYRLAASILWPQFAAKS